MMLLLLMGAHDARHDVAAAMLLRCARRLLDAMADAATQMPMLIMPLMPYDAI